MSETANYSWKISNFIERRFFQKMNLSSVKYLSENKLTNCSSKCSYISENSRENTRGNIYIKKNMFHNNKNNKIYKDSIDNNIFYVNATLVNINHKLSMKLFNRTPDQKAAKNIFPEKN